MVAVRTTLNTIRRVAKNDYETIPYQGDNRVDETIEAFFASTERARKAFRRQRGKLFDVNDVSLFVFWLSLMAKVLLLLGEAI